MKKRTMALLLLLLLVAACKQGEAPTDTPAPPPQPTQMAASPTPPPAATPLPPTPWSTPLPPAQADAVDQAIAYLAAELGVAAAQIELVSVEEVIWPDTSLGCPRPGMAYADVLVPGFLVRLASGGQEYELHLGNLRGQIVRCDHSEVSLGSPERAFRILLEYLTATHPGFGLAQMSAWEREDQTPPGVTGSSTLAWHGGDWTLTLSFPVVPNPSYEAVLSHTLAGVVWQGKLDGEQVSAEEELFPAVAVGTCDQSIRVEDLDEWAGVTVTVQDGTIHIEQNLSYVCCAELAVSAGREGNTIKVIETNVGEMCRCMCGYPLTIDLAGLGDGAYTVQVWGVQYFDASPLELLGSAALTLP